MTTASANTFDFIINRRAGTVLKTGEEELKKGLLSSFGGTVGSVTFVEGGDVASAVNAWAAAQAGQNRGLVIGGGDGTILAAAEQVMGRTDITLGILPLGTVNGIARKLGFAADFRAAAAQYASGESASMDVGMVNGMPFLCGLMIDESSVKIFEAREDLRDRKFASALRKAFSAAVHMLHRKTKMVVENGSEKNVLKGRIFALTPARLKPRALHHSKGEGLRDILAKVMALGPDNGQLSLYSVKGGLSLLHAVPSIIKGAWTSHASVHHEEGTQITLSEAGREGQKKTIVIDGEIKSTSYPLKASIIPGGLTFFRPRA